MTLMKTEYGCCLPMTATQVPDLTERLESEAFFYKHSIYDPFTWIFKVDVEERRLTTHFDTMYRFHVMIPIAHYLNPVVITEEVKGLEAIGDWYVIDTLKERVRRKILYFVWAIREMEE